VFAVRKTGQIVSTSYGTDDDIAPIAAIPPIGATARNIFLSAKAATTRSAVAALHVDCYPIDKHRKSP
jgi:hypothetical protein